MYRIISMPIKMRPSQGIDKIYAKEKSEIDLVIDLMQLRSLPKESW